MIKMKHIYCYKCEKHREFKEEESNKYWKFLI